MPASRPLEAMVKGSLMSLNDARNLTSEYRVFHGPLSEPFRYSPVFQQPSHVDAEGKLAPSADGPPEHAREPFRKPVPKGKKA